MIPVPHVVGVPTPFPRSLPLFSCNVAPMNSPVIAYWPLELVLFGDVLCGPRWTPVIVIEPEGLASKTVPQIWKRGTFEALALRVSLHTTPVFALVLAM